MATIVFADTTGHYDGRSLETEPLGGTEASVIRLARELARRGHAVTVHTNCDGAIEDSDVAWRPLSQAPPSRCDLYVAVQHPRLLRFVKAPTRRAIWVLWQPNNLKHYKQFWRMWRYRPVPILMSAHQARVYSPLLPRRSPEILIPLGLPEDVRRFGPLAEPPPRRAVFASNPSRNLNRLVRIWADRIHPAVPDATLEVFGIKDLKQTDDPWQRWQGRHLPENLSAETRSSVIVHPTAARETLISTMRQSRVMAYLGHKVEAFCLALAEAQAVGLPAVVKPIAALPERVIDGVTGFIRGDDEAFASATISLLTDTALWRRQHVRALELQKGISWPEYADRFETSLLGGRHRPRLGAGADDDTRPSPA